MVFQMEAGQIEVDGSTGIMTGTPYIPAAPPAQEDHFDSPKFDSNRASSTKMKKVNGANQESQEKEKDTAPSNAVHKFYIVI